MSVFVLKIIAVIFMVVDHIKAAIPSTYNNFTLYMGRISFPLFAFCAIQAYIHTRDVKKYLKRLFIAGLISEIPFTIFYSLPSINNYGLNIDFTLFLGVTAALIYDQLKETEKFKKYKVGNILGLILVCLLGVVGTVSRVDYGFFGIALIFSFSIFKESKVKTFFAAASVISGKYIYRLLTYGTKYGHCDYYIWNWICTLLPLFLILLYNGKKGKSFKWFFYIFYPLHLILLYVCSPYTYNLLNL